MTTTKKTIAVFLVILFILLGVYTSWRTHNGSTDFDTFYYAAKRLVNHEPLYLAIKNVSPYVYPPFFACLTAPLTLFNIEIASFIWYLLNLFFIFFSLKFCKVLIYEDKNIRDIWKGMSLFSKIASLFIIAVLFTDNISLLQANILVFFLVIAGLYYFKQAKPFLGGMLLAGAISIKIIPVLFLVYFIVKKEIKVVYSTVLWIVIFTLFVPSLFLGLNNTCNALKTWDADMLSNATSSVPDERAMGAMFNPVNQSIAAFVSKWFIKDDPNVSFWRNECYKYPSFLRGQNAFLTRRAALLISHIIMYGLAGLTLIYCVKPSADNINAASNYEFSLIFLASLFLNPVLRVQHFIFVLFAFLFLISRLNRKDAGYLFFSSGIAAVSIFYLLLSVKIFRIMGFGTIALLLLWLLVLLKYNAAEKKLS